MQPRPLEAPPGLEDLLLQFATAAVKAKPTDLVDFALAFFTDLNKEKKKQALTAARPLRVIISGAPASGKGTQCARIVAQWGLVHISVGDLLRAEVATASELGAQAQGFMERGELVPDELITALVTTRLAQPDCLESGWLLDGYPRTAAQAEALAAAGCEPDLFLSIQVPDEVLVVRVAGRRLDPETGEIFHLAFKQPPPEVSHRLVQRADDNEDTVRTRLATYKRHAEAVAAAYAGKAVAVDGDRPEAAVAEAVQAALQAAAEGAEAAAVA